MIVSVCQIIRDLNKDSKYEILIINYKEVFGTITFLIKLYEEEYLVPHHIMWNANDDFMDIRIFTIDYFKHRKLYSDFEIKKLVFDKNIVYRHMTDPKTNYFGFDIIQTIKLG